MSRTHPLATHTRRHPRRSPDGRATCRLALELLDDRTLPSASVVSGAVFQDVTGNGLSADDVGQAGVTVRLYQDANHNGKLDGCDPLVATQKTGADGSYTFGGLRAGKYLVAEAVPAGCVQTAPTAGPTVAVSLGAGQFLGGFDFANYRKPAAGVVTNVSFTVVDPVLGTYTVSDLRGHTRQGDVVTANFTVAGASPALVTLVSYDAPGAAFNAGTAAQQVIVDQQSALLAPGVHSLTVHIPDNYYQVDFVVGAAIDHFGPAGSNVFYSAQCRLVSADNGGTHAFAPATLSGVVYRDVNANGVFDAGADVALPGATVTVTGVNDLGQAVTVTAVTGPTGAYAFPGLREGTYTITQTSPAEAGYATETSQEAFALGGTASPGQIAGVHVPNGATGANYNLPEVRTAAAQTISGVVYDDPTRSGVYNPGDTGLQQIRVTLSGTDADGNPVSITVLTDVNGAYAFAGVPPGTYTLTYAPADGYIVDQTNDPLPPGATATAGEIDNIVVASGTSLVLNLPETPVLLG